MSATRLNTANVDLCASTDSSTKPLPLAEEIYQVSVTVGEPPQSLNLTLDYQQLRTTVFSNKKNKRAPVCYSHASKRNWFLPCTSRTLNKSSETPDVFYLYPPYTNECGTNAINALPRYFARDTFSLESFTLPITPIQVVEGVRGLLNPHWPSDGIFGINMMFIDNTTTTPDNSALERFLLAFQGHDTVATIHFADETPTFKTTAPGGLLTIGGVDDENCDGTWNYADSSPAWMIRIESVSFGDDVTYDDTIFGVMISASTFIRMPQTFLDRIIAAVNATYDFDTDTYSVPCDSRWQLPPLIFAIPFEHRVWQEDYARPVYNGVDEQCTLMLSSEQAYGYGYDDSWFHLGTTFTRSHCLLLDYSNGKVAFAKKA